MGISADVFPNMLDASFHLSPMTAAQTRKKETETLLISDIHLGSDLSRPDALLATLKQYTFRRLILLGDILDDMNFHRLPANHWELLAYLRTLCEPERNIEVVWVEGNHDRLL